MQLMHEPFGLPLPGFLHTEKGHYFWEGRAGESEREFSRRMASELEEMILREGPETVCGFISEPVMGAAACVTPPEGYFEEIQAVLKRHDVLFIADEVITGFGRLGAWFATDKYALEPDLMTLSKGITSAYIPLSASVIAENVWEVLHEGAKDIPIFAHGHTASAHPIACAAANANLALMEQEDMVGNAARVGAYFKQQLEERVGNHPLMGEIRGDGLMIAIELVANKETKEELNLEWDCSHRLFDSLPGGEAHHPRLLRPQLHLVRAAAHHHAEPGRRPDRPLLPRPRQADGRPEEGVRLFPGGLSNGARPRGREPRPNG